MAQDWPESDDIIEEIETLPVYSEGWETFYKELYSLIEYPDDAKNAKIEGKVFIEFWVEKDGTLSNTRIVKGVGYGCDEEAVRCLNEWAEVRKFVPGRLRDKIVRKKMIITFYFNLRKE